MKRGCREPGRPGAGHWRLRSFTLLCLLVSGACAPQVFKAYDGPERSLEEVALVEPRTCSIQTEWLFEELAVPEVRCTVRITKLDGAAVRFKEPKLAVVHGSHSFDLAVHYEDATQIYRDGRPRRVSESRDFVLTAELEAGHVYRIEGFLTYATPRALGVKIYDMKSTDPVVYTAEAREE